jgi:hypothetical protein
MRRVVAVAIYSILALGVITPMTAGAQAPPEQVDFEFDLVGACPFTVHFAVSGKTKAIANLPGDRAIFTSPGLHATLTNLSNPERQETFNITGSFHQTILENGDVRTEARGRNILWQFESREFESFLVLTVGTVFYIFDAQGNLKQSATGEGQRIDLCALLE